jgi:hypothetical protein
MDAEYCLLMILPVGSRSLFLLDMTGKGSAVEAFTIDGHKMPFAWTNRVQIK